MFPGSSQQIFKSIGLFTMTHNIDSSIPKYKECAGKRCKNSGNNKLKIKYIQKFGWFCDSCKNGLKKADLIDTPGMATEQ